MISRDEGGIGKYESKAVEVEAGKTYPASTWIPDPDEWVEPRRPSTLLIASS